jgi:hypothetical protein
LSAALSGIELRGVSIHQHVLRVTALYIEGPWPSDRDRTSCDRAGTLRSVHTWIESMRCPRGRLPFAW